MLTHTRTRIHSRTLSIQPNTNQLHFCTLLTTRTCVAESLLRFLWLDRHRGNNAISTSFTELPSPVCCIVCVCACVRVLLYVCGRACVCVCVVLWCVCVCVKNALQVFFRTRRYLFCRLPAKTTVWAQHKSCLLSTGKELRHTQSFYVVGGGGGSPQDDQTVISECTWQNSFHI